MICDALTVIEGILWVNGVDNGCLEKGGMSARHACKLVCSDSVHTLEIITRILSEVVNRERLCGTNAFYFSCFPEAIGGNFWGCQTP